MTKPVRSKSMHTELQSSIDQNVKLNKSDFSKFYKTNNPDLEWIEKPEAPDTLETRRQ